MSPAQNLPEQSTKGGKPQTIKIVQGWWGARLELPCAFNQLALYLKVFIFKGFFFVESEEKLYYIT